MTAFYLLAGVVLFLGVLYFGVLGLLNLMWREIENATGTGD